MVGYDDITNFYDVNLKHARHFMLLNHKYFNVREATLENVASIDTAIDEFQPDAIVHLATEAGVRYS